MNKTLIAFATAAVLSVFAAHASADHGGYAPPQQPAGGAPAGAGFGPIGGPGTLLGAGEPSGRAPDRYGFNPIFKRMFHFGGKNNCGNCGSAPAYSQAPAGPMQGTLVFPNHSFVRSPRDYFMMDVNK
ncbi:MAG: hypothetical protein C0467_14540 [Planctomycetaceae bacterium]|nr:hypothetical protein [Planctomycetaceae bacterium]